MSQRQDECGKEAVASCGHELSRIKNSTIDHIEFQGGSKYGNQLKIYFTDGKLLHVDAEMDLSRHGIRPRMAYSIGAWGRL